MVPASLTCRRGDALDDALASIDLDRCSLTIADQQVAGSTIPVGDARSMVVSNQWRRQPARAVADAKTWSDRLHDASTSNTPVTRTLAFLGTANAKASIEVCTSETFSTSFHPLATALGVMPIQVRGVPYDLQRALVPIVSVMKDVHADVLRHRASAENAVAQTFGVSDWLLGRTKLSWSPSLHRGFDDLDGHALTSAAVRLALTVETSKLKAFVGKTTDDLVIPTAWGTFVLGGPAANVHTDDAPWIVIDTGGDDRYEGRVGASTPQQPASLVVDLGGRDRYTGEHGAGNAGIGMAFDFGSEGDFHGGAQRTQGVGSHGIGVLYDEDGPDEYVSMGFSQGSAAWGVGLLLDGGGDDTYQAITHAQGFGFTRGEGAIVDVRGHDRYRADPGDPSLGGSPVFLSNQLPGPPTSTLLGNRSLAQGAGGGYRPEDTSGDDAFPGGIGVLFDDRGNDAYEAGVYGQGVGFQLGAGILIDREGSDEYRGLYYVQGAAAHAGVGLFFDAGGDDRYNAGFPVQHAALGLGHDWGVGVAYEGGGNDVIAAPGLSLGAGSSNGIGAFMNVGGEDRVTVADTLGLGAAVVNASVQARRRDARTVGVFVSTGGRTAYRVGDKDAPLRGQTWRSVAGTQLGVGVDHPDGSVLP